MSVIYQSQINELNIDFDQEVEALRQAKLAHRFDTNGSPSPLGHPLLEAAIRTVKGKLISENPPIHEGPDDFVLDYEIVDDIYKPTLDDKKKKLKDLLYQEQDRRLSAIIPQGKMRLFNIKAYEIRSTNFLFRTSKQRKLLKEIDQKKAMIDSIIKHSATVESDIDDLTDETIDTWVLPEWPVLK